MAACSVEACCGPLTDAGHYCNTVSSLVAGIAEAGTADLARGPGGGRNCLAGTLCVAGVVVLAVLEVRSAVGILNRTEIRSS